ncbi:cupin domain-containing protein [Loktanella salsilacus]|uniref:cupin domain-containing protein n=1 Tax=Loktanella salsilacus TaxID=195913 RepID=UPI003735A95E
MVHMLTGTVTLIEGDTQTPMHPGDTACFKAGVPVGHCLRNDGDAPASYMVIGTRSGCDDVTYPLTGDTLSIRNGIKTYRNTDGTVINIVPYHGA